MKFKHLLPVAALCATQVNAEVNFNGFATIAGGMTTGSDEVLDNYNEDISYENDSLFGLQVNSQLDENLSFTGQLIARGNDNWNTNVEWAYLTYEANDNVRFLIGKQRGPYYMYTDFVDVGFAYHWVTPPRGVYDLPVGTVTGINTIITGSAGPVDSTFQVLFGRERGDTLLDGVQRESDINDLLLFAWTVNYDWLTLRAARTTAEISLDFQELQPLIDGWRQTPFAGVADALEFNQDEATFSNLGMKIELGDFQLITEFSEFESDDNFTGEPESYYVSAVYRADDFAFHVTYGEDETLNDFSALANVPVGADPLVDGLIATTNGVLASRNEDTNSITVGFRWDFNPSAALKVEYTDLTDELTSNDVGLLRFAVTTVF